MKATQNHVKETAKARVDNINLTIFFSNQYEYSPPLLNVRRNPKVLNVIDLAICLS
jgi:hypothetical protein